MEAAVEDTEVLSAALDTLNIDSDQTDHQDQSWNYPPLDRILEFPNICDFLIFFLFVKPILYVLAIIDDTCVIE